MLPRLHVCALLIAASLPLALAACGNPETDQPSPDASVARPPTSGDFTPRRLPRPVPTAAEPAASPPVTGTVPGRRLSLGQAPEGIVADGPTRTVAVAVREPNQLVLVDTDTEKVRTRVSLPGHLRHLQLAAAGGPVLVPDEIANALITVGLPGGKILSQVPTGESPHDANQASDGTILVADEAGATLSAVRGSEVVKTFDDVTQPGGIAHVGTTFGVVDVGENTLTFYDAATLTPITELSAGDGPTHVVADRHGRLIVVDTRGGALLVYAPPTSGTQAALVARLALPGQPYGVTYDATTDQLWVTITATNEVAAFDVSQPEPREVRRIKTLQQPNTVAVDPTTGKVFVTCTAPGVVQVVDPD